MALAHELVWRLEAIRTDQWRPSETGNWAEVLERIAQAPPYSSGELSWLTSLRLSSGLLLSVTAGFVKLAISMLGHYSRIVTVSDGESRPSAPRAGFISDRPRRLRGR